MPAVSLEETVRREQHLHQLGLAPPPEPPKAGQVGWTFSQQSVYLSRPHPSVGWTMDVEVSELQLLSKHRDWKNTRLLIFESSAGRS